MKTAAKDLEFEKAAMLRDQVVELRRTLALEDTGALLESLNERPSNGATRESAASYTARPVREAGGSRTTTKARGGRRR